MKGGRSLFGKTMLTSCSFLVALESEVHTKLPLVHMRLVRWRFSSTSFYFALLVLFGMGMGGSPGGGQVGVEHMTIQDMEVMPKQPSRTTSKPCLT